MFSTFSNPIWNLNLYINADPNQPTYMSNIKQDSEELCHNLRYFIITLIHMAHFRPKNIFYKTNIEDGQRVPWNCSFDFELHFLQNFFLQNWCDFWGFLKFTCLVPKSETGMYTGFFGNFGKILRPNMLTVGPH